MAELGTEILKVTRAPALVTCFIGCFFAFFLSLYLFFSFLVWHLLPIHCRCGRLLLHLTTFTDTPQSAGLLWTSDQQVAETSTWQHTTLTTDIHAPGGIRTHNPSMRAAADLQLVGQVSGTVSMCAGYGVQHTCTCGLFDVASRTFGVLDTASWAALTCTFCPNCKLYPHLQTTDPSGSKTSILHVCIYLHINTHVVNSGLSENFNQQYVNTITAIIFILLYLYTVTS
jgi:hypothetical protein